MTGGPMKQDDERPTVTIPCEPCGAVMPAYDVVSCGSIEEGYRQICFHCFNAEMAGRQGLADFENCRFDEIAMTDCAGMVHDFHFRTRLMGAIVALDAFELKDGEPAGYQFQIIGEAGDDLFSLLGRLVERIRRKLSAKYLVQTEHGPQIADLTVCAQIDWDAAHDGRVPLLVMDGEEVSWDEFGRMLMTFEGWQFRMEIADRSGEN